MVAKIHSWGIISEGLWIYFAGSCHWWVLLCWWGRKQRSAWDLSQGCHQLESSLIAAPPQPPLNSHSISTIPNPLVGVDKSISCAPKLPPHVQGAFRAEGWDLHSQPRGALSTDPPTCLCQLMEVIFTSFHLEKRRQKSSNNLPGSRSVEEISLAHSQQVTLRAAQRRIALARDAEQHLGTPESPTHTQLGTGTCRGQTLPTFGITSPPSSPVPAL